MTKTVVLAALCVVACGRKETVGKYEIKRDLKRDSTKETGLPRGEATFAAAKPGLRITAGTGPLADGARAELESARIAPHGNVRVAIQASPESPKPSGTLTFTLQVDAVFAHPPEVSKLHATIHGTLKHSGTTPEQLGHELGDIVEDWFAEEKLPAKLGPPTEAPPIVELGIGPPLCTRHADNSVRCRDNGWDMSGEAVPLAVTDTKQLASGNNYGACGVRANGKVYCVDAWDNVSAMEARDVCGVANAVSVSVGQQSACALIADGTVKCWGRRTAWYEPCGKALAVAVNGVTDAVMLDAGAFQACVVTKAGTVQCWELCGKGCTSGIVGEVDTHADTASLVKGLTKATLVHAAFHVCAATDNKVTCIDKSTKKPWTVTLPAAVKTLGYTSDEMCALTADKTISCWSYDIDGKKQPTVVPGITDVVAFGADITGACAASARELVCWGGSNNTPPENAKHLEM